MNHQEPSTAARLESAFTDAPEHPGALLSEIAAIRHTLMTGLSHNPAINALNRLAARMLPYSEGAVPEPVPARTLAIVDAHHAMLMAALDAKDAEIARLTAAVPVPVTDAEVEAAVVRFYGQGPVPICHGNMRAALNAFQASRGQA